MEEKAQDPHLLSQYDRFICLQLFIACFQLSILPA